MKNSATYFRRRWLIQAPLSLMIIGFGICLISEAAMLKYSGVTSWEWVKAGTLALVVFNTGLCLFGDSILQRVRYENFKP
ncbi:MAG: hypothetical protein AAF433_20170 [Bacteroidota bacterium]